MYTLKFISLLICSFDHHLSEPFAVAVWFSNQVSPKELIPNVQVILGECHHVRNETSAMRPFPMALCWPKLSDVDVLRLIFVLIKSSNLELI